MRLQEVASQLKSLLAVLAAFTKFQNFKTRIVFGQNLAKTHLTLLVTAIGNGAGKQGDFAFRFLTQKTSNRVARQATGLPIVDTDEGAARRIRTV